jgi:hypothetical protein
MEPIVVRLMAAAGMVLIAVGAWVWRRAAGSVELTADELTIRHPSLSGPLRLSVRSIIGVLVGAAIDVGWPTTLPRSTLPSGATLVLALDDAVELPTMFARRRASVRAIALRSTARTSAGGCGERPWIAGTSGSRGTARSAIADARSRRWRSAVSTLPRRGLRVASPGDRVTASYVRRDAYRTTAGFSVCQRTEPFVARRSG